MIFRGYYGHEEMKVTFKKGAFLVGVYSHWEVFSTDDETFSLHYYKLTDHQVTYNIDKELSITKSLIAVNEKDVKEVDEFERVGGERFSDNKKLERQTHWPIDIGNRVVQTKLKEFQKKMDQEKPDTIKLKEAIEMGYSSEMDKFFKHKELFLFEDEYSKTVRNWLLIAVKHNRIKIVKWLLEHPKIFLIIGKNEKAKILYEACKTGNLLNIQLLIENGYNINDLYFYKPDTMGDDPIVILAKRSQFEIIQWLLDRQLVIMTHERFKWILILLNDVKIMDLVIKLIPIDSQQDYLNKGLITSVVQDHYGLTHKFLDLGANINYLNEEGHTPICSALLYNTTSILKILIEMGANKTLGKIEGLSPIEYAVSLTENPKYIEILKT